MNQESDEQKLPIDSVSEQDKIEHVEQNESPESDITETSTQEFKIRSFLESMDKNAIIELLILRRKILGEEKYDASVETIGSYEDVLSTLLNEHSAEADRVRTAIDKIEDKSQFASKLIRDGKTILGNPVPNRSSGKGVVLSGSDAKAALAIRTGRMKRIPLYNSGFFIDIVQPDLGMLNNFFNKAQTKTDSYGRKFGVYFYFFHSLMIEEAVVELIQPLIRNSTLKNWNKGETLLRNIKHSDLKLILNALGALMFPEGFNYTHVCSNLDGTCTHYEEKVIDINKLVHHNYRKLTNANIITMQQQKEINQESLDLYQKQLGFDGKEIRHNSWGFTLKVPSIQDHLDYGRMFNGNLLNNTFVDNSSDIDRALLFSFYRVYTPYISKLTLYDENNEVDIITEDKEVIADTLAQLQESDKDSSISTALNSYISDTEISYLGYPSSTCPECGHIPKSGYDTVDPLHNFFIQSIMKLSKS